jgi:hypothetical protein
VTHPDPVYTSNVLLAEFQIIFPLAEETGLPFELEIPPPEPPDAPIESKFADCEARSASLEMIEAIVMP